MKETDEADTRVAEDEHGLRAVFEDIEVGKDLGTLEWEITEADLEKQCSIDLDYHPWYFGESPFGGRIAPPQIQYRPPRWLLSRNYNVRGVLYKWEFENIGPLRVGEPITVTGRIAEKWVERDREYVKFESTGTNKKGEIVFRTMRTHVLDMVKRTAPRVGRGLDSGIKKEKI